MLEASKITPALQHTQSTHQQQRWCSRQTCEWPVLVLHVDNKRDQRTMIAINTVDNTINTKLKKDENRKKWLTLEPKVPLLARGAHEFKRPTTVIKNYKTNHLLKNSTTFLMNHQANSPDSSNIEKWSQRKEMLKARVIKNGSQTRELHPCRPEVPREESNHMLVFGLEISKWSSQIQLGFTTNLFTNSKNISNGNSYWSNKHMKWRIDWSSSKQLHPCRTGAPKPLSPLNQLSKLAILVILSKIELVFH